jgi:hypothetical protein
MAVAATLAGGRRMTAEQRVEERLSELTQRVRASADRGPRLAAALISGSAGALAVTAVHQLARRRVRYAPRMDVLGMRAIARGTHRLGKRPPTGRTLYRATLAGDLLSNTAYYSTVALAGRHATRTGAALGIAAGVGALLLPPVMGLGRPPHAGAWSNRLMTVAWYTLGGLAAGCTYQQLHAHDGGLDT